MPISATESKGRGCRVAATEFFVAVVDDLHPTKSTVTPPRATDPFAYLMERFPGFSEAHEDVFKVVFERREEHIA